MKKIIHDDHADVKMVGAVVGLLVTLIVSILVFYNIAASVDTSTMDENFGTDWNTGSDFDESENATPSANATDDILGQSSTFFQIAPIIAIVVVAVVILGYVSKI